MPPFAKHYDFQWFRDGAFAVVTKRIQVVDAATERWMWHVSVLALCPSAPANGIHAMPCTPEVPTWHFAQIGKVPT